jgi:hypothetical protein
MKKTLQASALALILFCSHFVIGQSITLGTGTAVNGTTTSSPVNIWYRRCVNQTVYTVAELNAAGITGPSTLRRLGYYVTQAPLYDIPGYQISMKHTTQANANNNLEGGYTVVKNGFTYSPEAGGWDMIKLDNPFNWNGTQNIVVRVCWTQVQPNYDASGQCRIYNSTNGYRHRWDDNAGGACGLVPNTTTNDKPQIQFVFDTLTVWTGATNSNWNLASNWTKGVPTKYIDARIPTGTPNNPNITTAVNCEELILQGTMTLAATGTLNVFSHFTNTGTFTDNGGVTIMQGKGASIISGNLTFANLRIESVGGTSVTSGITNISKELQVNKSIFNTGNAVVLKSTAAGTARIAELKSTCVYTLNMFDSYGDGWNGGLLTVLENGVSIGTFSATGSGSTANFSVASGSTITLNYTSGSWENENSFNLQNPFGAVIFTDNAPIATGNIYSTTASGPYSPLVVGNITMERYIDAGATYWRNFSSAVQGATIGMYTDDFMTAGFPGSPWPAFPFNSIYTYNETQGAGLGWVGCTGTSQVIGLGQGLYVWSGDTITGTDPFTLDLVGPANQGNITMPVTFTNTGTVNEDGWNLVGNPYPSTIDWDSPNWTKTNIANAVYVQNPDNQQYAAYVSGASTNGGSRYIPSQQSFWVYASAASPQLLLKENCKSSVDQQFLKTTPLSPGVTITLEGSGYSDETVVRHIDGASDPYELEFDAVERWGGWGDVPQLSAVNSVEEDLTIHSFDLQGEELVVPLRAVVFSTGDYTLKFDNIDELAVPCLKLEDVYTGMMYDVTEGSSFVFEMSDTTWSPRFYLHIGKNYPVAQNDVSCFDGNDGSIQVDLNDTTITLYNLISDAGVTTGTTDADPLVVNVLAAGNYILEIPSLVNSCSQTTFEFVVSESTILELDAVISEEQNGNDGEINASVSGGTPPYVYTWSNGATTPLISNLQAGVYYLTVMDANSCFVESSYTVSSSLATDQQTKLDPTINYQTESNQLVLTGFNFGSPQRIVVLNNLGQVVYNEQMMLNGVQYLIPLPAELATGVYTVQVGTENNVLRFVRR